MSKLIEMSLTQEEEELIAAIRNYKAAYPNGQKELLYYIQQVLDEMLDMD